MLAGGMILTTLRENHLGGIELLARDKGLVLTADHLAPGTNIADIARIPQQDRDRLRLPLAPLLVRDAHAIHLAGNFNKRLALIKQAKHRRDILCRQRIGFQLAMIADIAIGNDAAAENALRLGGEDLVLHTIGGHLALKLSERDKHRLGDTTDRRRSVELLGDGDETDLVLLEDLLKMNEADNRADQTVELVDDHDVDLPRLDACKHVRQSRSFDRTAGIASVGKHNRMLHPTMKSLRTDVGSAGVRLGLQRIVVHIEAVRRRLADIDRGHFRLLRQNGFLFRRHVAPPLISCRRTRVRSHGTG